MSAAYAPVRAPLIVVSGPSGVGKTTLVSGVISSCKLPLRRAITATTRQPRLHGNMLEGDGLDYHFWSVDTFQNNIDTGLMAEHATYGNNCYGTPRSEIDSHRKAGTGVLLVIEVQGAEQIRLQYRGDCLSIFILPPSWDDLVTRLQSRNSETPEKIAARLATAKQELLRANEFDVRLVNDTLDSATTALLRLVEEQFQPHPAPE